MITYKPIIIQGGRRRDGTWPVKIRVTFKGVSRRLPTTLVCEDADLTRSGRIKNNTILEKADELIKRMREACSNLSPFTLEGWTVDEVVAHIRQTLGAQDFKLDFFEFADSYLACKKPQTRLVYTTALNALERFLGKRELDVNEITRAMLLDFSDFVDTEYRMHWTRGELVPTSIPKKIKGGSSRVHLQKLAHIFSAAKFRYNDEDTGHIFIPRSPFDGLKKGYPVSVPRDPIEADVLQRLIDAQPQSELERIARAAFLVSFCTMGANLADLYEAKTPDGDIWNYNRKKTRDRRPDRAPSKVSLSSILAPLVRDLGGHPGSEWWLPALHHWGRDTIATAALNKGLRRWQAREGEKDFTFGAARHTWGTIAREIKIEKATVDEALVHVGDFRITDIYAKRNWSLAWEANEKVLALFDWSNVTKEDGPPDV